MAPVGTFTAQSGNLCLPECKFDIFIDRDIYWSNSYFEIPSRIIINGQPKKKRVSFKCWLLTSENYISRTKQSNSTTRKNQAKQNERGLYK